MNTNLASQKPTINDYEYLKQRHIKKTYRKRHNNNALYSIITTVLIVISSFFITQDFYILKNSQDLYYAVEYNFTRANDINDSLLRVQYMTLISSDGQNATVEVSGLSKAKPHHTISMTGNFTRVSNKSWQIKEITHNQF
ncbi:hypothetical protein [uncultured Clostridium sp.]|uniref:hypothetical protein n=1 Tax=uncultured Clostridium sp. TaxID=59620 RepID=UPI0025D14ED0|nr:hypothetical protein [uncultured Clostridium sp.]